MNETRDLIGVRSKLLTDASEAYKKGKKAFEDFYGRLSDTEQIELEKQIMEFMMDEEEQRVVAFIRQEEEREANLFLGASEN